MSHVSYYSELNSRTRSLAMGPPVLARDRFKEKADRKAAKRGAQPKGDAFASAAKPAPADDVRNAASAAPLVEASKPTAFRSAIEASAKLEQPKARRADLHVVASQAVVEPVVQIERQEARRVKPAAKASSLVLVSSSNVVEAAEAPAPAPAETGGPGALEMPKIDKPEKEQKPARRSDGGGGGSAGGGGAGSGAAGPPRDRILNQDDLIAVLLVGVMLILLLLYLIRPGATTSPDDRILNTQFAASQTEAPPAPKPDPFGDGPVDLTPKSPLPPPAVESAPAPAPAVEAVEVTMHAWFCTAKSELTPVTVAALDQQVAEWGPKLASRELVVRGYADTRGGSDYNLALGSARASAVADYLKSKGVKVAAASGIGELPDLTDNQNCANQRRVDVRLSDMADEAPDRSCKPPKAFAELMCG